MHLSAYGHSSMDYRQRVCPHGIETDGLPDFRPVYPSLCSHYPGNTLPWIISLWCFSKERTIFLVGQAYSLEVRTVNLRWVFPTRPFDTCPVAKVNPHLGMSSSGPQGFPGKSPRPIGVVFCLKNLPYPLCDLLESHRNETNGDRNTQKKTKDSRSSNSVQ